MNLFRSTLLVFLPLFTLAGLSAQGSCTKNDCKDGYGEYRFVDGARYHGEFKGGKLHGQGVLYYPDGSKYVGNWRNQLQQGKGRLSQSDGSVYFGMWHEGEFHGKGEYTYANGNRLDAVWEYGQAVGQGTIYYANDDVYQGEVFEGQMQGHGILSYSNGDRYIGDWYNNQRQGKGRMTFADGSTVEGDWTSDYFRGNWDMMGFRGKADGLKNCASGCHNEEGQYRYPDGTVYRGNHADGVPNGNGSIYYPGGNVYEGAVVRHRPEGLGVMRYSDGLIAGGMWKDGVLFRTLYESYSRPVSPVTVEVDPEVKIWAVIVGAERYQHMPSLKYTKSDAFYLYSHLRSPLGGALPNEQIRLLVDEDATHHNIIASMQDVFLRADENDLVLFYFSGHGLQGAFLPVDYDGFDHRLEHYEIRDALLMTRARHKVVIADACHSGSFSSGTDLPGMAVRSGIDDKLKAYYKALDDAHPGTALLLSSKGIEYSLEDGGLRSGVFSHFLIKGLAGRADLDKDEMVSIQELFDYVHREVRTYTGNRQTPTLSGDFDPGMPVSLIRK